MSRFHSHLNTSVKLLAAYNGAQPFALYLKAFFGKEKKYGSKDRKQIAALCYDYFRLGFAMQHVAIEEKIMAATFLCEHTESPLLAAIKPEWNEKITEPLEMKIALLHESFLVDAIFPFKNQLSAAIAFEPFSRSLLIQPFLFLRLRPHKRSATLAKLKQSNIAYQLIGEHCIQLPSSTRVDEFLIPDEEVVIQDQNSQKVFDYLREKESVLFGSAESQNALSVWDCCSASGGKSILLQDTLSRKIDLTVSDIRQSILMNLHERFKIAQIKNYKHFVADLSKGASGAPEGTYQLIICDAPCTGSGTWGRTPEQLCFFTESTIEKFSATQRSIVTNAITCLEEGGVFVYITCSIFREENEAIAQFIEADFGVQLMHQQILIGYESGADTMFVAIFKKPSIV